MQKLVLTLLITIATASDIENIIFPTVKLDATSRNQLCNDEIKIYQRSIKNLTLWAHEMWDASAKYPTAILRGNVYNFGNIDECLTISGPFKTQYCLTTIEVITPTPNPLWNPFSLDYFPYESVLNSIQKVDNPAQKSRNAVQFGLCIPASCNHIDLQQLVNNFLSGAKHPLKQFNVSYKAQVSPNLCYSQNDVKHIDNSDMLYCVVCLLLILMVFLSTLYDYSTETYKQPGSYKNSNNILSAFSLLRNFKTLTYVNNTNGVLNILDGIRTICLCYIISEHRFAVDTIAPSLNFDFVEKLYRYKLILLLPIVRGDFIVDVMFIIGGLLATYGFLKHFEQKIPSPLFVILYRYIRLTPLYIFTIFGIIMLSKFHHPGPLWNSIVEPEIDLCHKYWWLNLLYISNYVNVENVCAVYSWYLPCDFHLFIFAFFCTRILSRNKKRGLILLIAFLLASTIVTLMYTVIYEYPPFIKFYPSNMLLLRNHTHFNGLYIKSHIRVQTYILGMLAGYVYYELRNSVHRLSKTASNILTSVSLLAILSVMLSSTRYFDPYYKYSVIESGVFAAFHRILWSLGAIGIIFSISHGHASMLKRFLSMSFWTPLSKLGFGAYLIHLIWQYRSLGVATISKNIQFLHTVGNTISDIILTYLTAFVLYLLLEAPVRNVFNVLFQMGTQRKVTRLQ